MLSVFRSPRNPLLSPVRANAFEAIGTFNPSAVVHESDTHLFYRAMAEPDQIRTPGRGFSTIGYTCLHKDGGFENRKQVIAPKEDWETYGCEDPRATFFEGKWYVFYTALGGYPFGPDNIKAAVAIGDRPDELTERHLVTPFNAKAATLFPERINGQVVMLVTAHTDFTEEHPRPTIGLAHASNIEDFWNPEFWNVWHEHLENHAFPDVRRADTEHVEIGATPILTKEGWLLVYSHIQNYYDERNRIFGIEALLLDSDDPQQILAKTEFPFLVPEEPYEKYGVVSNVVFPSGALVNGDTLRIFYGAADTVAAEAALSLSDLLSCMYADKRAQFMNRVSEQPILSPDPSHPWESLSTFNAAAIELEGSIHLLYRAMGEDGISRLGYAQSKDGIHIDERLPDPVYKPREVLEARGTEDPRLTRIGDVLYLTYTAFDGVLAHGALSTISVDDFLARNFNWSSPQFLSPVGINDKDFCIFPEPIGGKTMLIHRIDPNICVDFLDEFPPPHAMDTAKIKRSIDLMVPRLGMWDGIKVGSAAPPIRVEEGWLYLYHAVGPDFAYRLGAALLDAEAGISVISRTAMPILEPILEWERKGQVHNVVFSCGAVLRDDTLYVYYGGGDCATGVATLSKKEIIKRLLPSLHIPL